MAVYQPDPGCDLSRDADDTNFGPAAVDMEELGDFDFESDHTHDY